MNFAPSPKLLAIGASCAALGAGAGVIANSSAAGHATPAKTGKSAKHQGRHGGKHPMRRVVHADLVVAQPGDTFGKDTLDRGTVKSGSGDQLTVVEQTPKAVYKTVTLTIPAGARVRDNGHPAKLDDVTPGQRVRVRQGSKHTLVRARDARHK